MPLGQGDKTPAVMYIMNFSPPEVRCFHSSIDTYEFQSQSIHCLRYRSSFRPSSQHGALRSLLTSRRCIPDRQRLPVDLQLYGRRDLTHQNDRRFGNFVCATCITQCITISTICAAACGPGEVLGPVGCAVWFTVAR